MINRKPISKSELDKVIFPIRFYLERSRKPSGLKDLVEIENTLIFVAALSEVTKVEIDGLEEFKRVVSSCFDSIKCNKVFTFTEEQYLMGCDLVEVLIELMKRRARSTITKALDLALHRRKELVASRDWQVC